MPTLVGFSLSHDLELSSRTGTREEGLPIVEEGGHMGIVVAGVVEEAANGLRLQGGPEGTRHP